MNRNELAVIIADMFESDPRFNDVWVLPERPNVVGFELEDEDQLTVTVEDS